MKAALECSIYVAPTDPGLTHAELLEIGKRLGLQEGEILDAIPAATGPAYFGDSRLQPARQMMWSAFHSREEPDYRSVPAFDFVSTELISLVRSHGVQNARLERTVLVARGERLGIPRQDIETAITIMLLDQHLIEEEGAIRFARGRETYPIASEQVKQIGASRADQRPKKARAEAYPVVKDVIGRRNDGRQPSAEPLDAFSNALEKLGYGPFRLWWTQTLAELTRSDPSLSPVTVCVLSAALVEGALTFVVKHGRALGLGVFGSTDFDREPRTWKIDDLVSSACAGRESAILDTGTRQKADELIRFRQRIHAGRMLSDFPRGVPDLRPEEARESRRTADLVVRRILDWLEKYPPA